MRLKTKRAFPCRQANGNAHKHTDSVSQRRLSDEEWRDLWTAPYSAAWIIALLPLIAAALGVI